MLTSVPLTAQDPTQLHTSCPVTDTHGWKRCGTKQVRPKKKQRVTAAQTQRREKSKEQPA